MAINISPGTPLRHISTVTSSGSVFIPVGTTIAFVSIHSSTGGTGGMKTDGYRRYSGTPGAGGPGVVSGAFVQVTPGANAVVTIGAGGSPGADRGSGSTGGNTIFDGAITQPGSAGGAVAIQAGRYTPNGFASAGASAPAATGTTSLTSLSPGGTTLVRTKTITSQATGGSGGGSGGSRYSVGSAGASGIVHVYI